MKIKKIVRINRLIYKKLTFIYLCIQDRTSHKALRQYKSQGVTSVLATRRYISTSHKVLRQYQPQGVNTYSILGHEKVLVAVSEAEAEHVRALDVVGGGLALGTAQLHGRLVVDEGAGVLFGMLLVLVA